MFCTIQTASCIHPAPTTYTTALTPLPKRIGPRPPYPALPCLARRSSTDLDLASDFTSQPSLRNLPPFYQHHSTSSRTRSASGLLATADTYHLPDTYGHSPSCIGLHLPPSTIHCDTTHRNTILCDLNQSINQSANRSLTQLINSISSPRAQIDRSIRVRTLLTLTSHPEPS